MNRYHVHVYPVFRVRVPDVEADSPEEACEKAEQAVNFAQFAHLGLEYADGIDGFLVDEDGDTEHQRSASYDANYVRREL